MVRPSRSAWIDHLRSFVIALVVSMHACVTYSGLGGWYDLEGRGADGVQKVLFGIWQAHLQAFFMGLLFLIGGVFAASSLVRRGRGAFLRERLRRLGLPALLYMTVVHPFIVLVINPRGTVRPDRAEAYLRYLASVDLLGGSGPLWFVLALLLFSAALTLLPRSAEHRESPELRGWHVLVWGLGLGLVSYLVRLVQPIGTDVLNFQLGYFPQYVVAFGLGVWLARRGGLEAIAQSSVAHRAGWIGLVLGPPLLGAVAQGLHGPPDALNGGASAQSLAMALWEQTIGAALALGCLSLFARRVREETPSWRWLDDRAFAVYVFHAVVLVVVAMAMRPWSGAPLAKAIVLTAISLPLSFGLSDLVRRVPGLRSIL